MKKIFFFALLMGGVMLITYCDTTTNNTNISPTEDLVEGAEELTNEPSRINLNSSTVPDGPSYGASQDELFKFAWEQFVALNWPVEDPSVPGNRATPSSDTSATFTSITADNTPTVVWHTYVSKAEAFGPATESGMLPDWSELGLPSYSYEDQPTVESGVNYQLYNNLDENNEIGEAFVWGGAGHGNTTGGNQVLYEAKFNKTEYNYIRRNQLNSSDNRKTWINNSKKDANLTTYGGTCKTFAAAKEEIICFPCTEGKQSDEGVIEIKAAWRELVDGVDDPSRYYTHEVIVYENQGSGVKAVNKTYALVGLHIIRKTRHYPTFIFTTFNHVDNIKTGVRYVNESAAVGQPAYYKEDANGTPQPFDTIPDTIPGGSIAILKQEDVHTIQPELIAFNAAAQQQINAANENSVWQYYELLGVQATPTDISQADDDPTYYLANDVIETDHVLTRFTSRLNDTYSILLEKPNIYYQKPGISDGGKEITMPAKVNMGGCKGCHGNAQITGTDFSFLLTKKVLEEADALGTANDKK